MRFALLAALAASLALPVSAEIPADHEVITSGLAYSQDLGLKVFVKVGTDCNHQETRWGCREVAPGVTECTHARTALVCPSYGTFSYDASPSFQVDLSRGQVMHAGTATPVADMFRTGDVYRIFPRHGSRIEIRPEGARFFFKDLAVQDHTPRSTFELLHR